MIGQRTVHQQIRMDRHFPRGKRHVDDLAIFFGRFELLVQDVRVLLATAHLRAMVEPAEPVRAANELHASIFGVRVVDRHPDGEGPRVRHGPIAGVLMPSDHLTVARHLAEIMGAPTDDVRTEKVSSNLNESLVA